MDLAESDMETDPEKIKNKRVRTLELESRNISGDQDMNSEKENGDNFSGLVSKYLIKKVWNKEDEEPEKEENDHEKNEDYESREKKDIQKQQNRDLLGDEREDSVKTLDPKENQDP